MTIIHKFEQAGLGKAPFRLVGMFEKRGPITMPNGVQVGAPGQPCGTCDYCGTGIANCYQIRSADGKKFVVGEDCVRKTGDVGLVDTVKREANKTITQHRKEKNKAKIEAAHESIMQAIEANRDKPHPNPYWAAQGQTLADNIDWLWQHSGVSGRLKLIKQWCKGGPECSGCQNESAFQDSQTRRPWCKRCGKDAGLIP